MKRKILSLLTIAHFWQVLLCGLFICLPQVPQAFAAGKYEPFTAIPPRQALEMIQQNKGNPNFVLMDVRTPDEFAEGHIEGAVNVNYNADDFIDNLNKLDKDKTYLIYCRTGRRSSDAIDIMKRLKFKEVYRIQGDIVRWKSEKLPLVTP